MKTLTLADLKKDEKVMLVNEERSIIVGIFNFGFDDRKLKRTSFTYFTDAGDCGLWKESMTEVQVYAYDPEEDHYAVRVMA